MTSFLTSCNKFVSVFVLPLWVGLLMLPFTGLGNAVRVFAMAVVVMLLWRLSSHDAAASVRRSVAKKIATMSAAASNTLRYAASPYFAISAVLFLFLLPVFLNDYYRDIMTLT
jgi:hypothetical protein